MLVLFAAVSFLQAQDQSGSPSPISLENIKHHLAYLASDDLKGRATGSTGAKLAADYIASQLADFGITPFGDHNTYFQNIPMHGSKAMKDSRLRFIARGEERVFEHEKDYLLYDCGASTFIALPQPMAFVGYGIVAPEYDYNDYLGIDVAGKIVVFLSGEPISEHEDYFAGAHNTIHANPDVKRRVALARGALGTIMIPNPRTESDTPWSYWQHQFAFDNISLLYTRATNLNILLNPEMATTLFSGSPFEYRHVIDMENADLIQSFNMTGKLAFSGIFQEWEFVDRNVIGLIPGRDKKLKNQFVLIAAHYDHLGIGPAVKGDSIYNGVADNAFGVSATLEIARIIASAPQQPKRSILLVFTTGEEKGLLGATYYIDHPRVPLHKTYAAVNIDGIAMFDTFKNFVGIGAEYSTMENLLQELAKGFSLEYSPVPAIFANSNALGRSDQIAFAREGIPTVALVEGMKYDNATYESGVQRFIDWGATRYHTPFDDLDQPINYAAVQQHCNLLLGLISILGNTGKSVEFHPNSQFLNARLQSIAEER
ncbi:MAG: M28 family peptidase [Deferribacteres bacterium]|nr:M28 family peptidase [candidate division KSB1 bacterium]MCB9504177.1 M28 family peptidase [Deferribacteres bacterium]